MTRACVFLLGLSSLIGCGSGVSLPPAPLAPQDSAGGEDTRAGLPDTPPAAMTLFPGDVISVTSVSADTTNLEGLRVDEAGRIHLPLAGDIEVGGLELRAAETRIEEAMHQFDRFARVSIRVTDPAGHHMTVLGAVGHPGQISVGQGARLSDVIALAGGLLTQTTPDGRVEQLADIDGGTISRGGHELPVSLHRALVGDPRHNVRVRPGDQVYVPPAPPAHVSVFGEVGHGDEVPFREGLRLTEALALAGGDTIHSDGDMVRIVRGPAAHPRAYGASIEAITTGHAHDPILAAGDVVYVDRSAGARFGDAMARLGPVIGAAITIAVTVALILSTHPP